MKKNLLLVWITALFVACFAGQAGAQTKIFAAPPQFVSTQGNLHFPLFASPTTFTSFGGSQGNDWEVGGPTGPLWHNNAGIFEAKGPGGSLIIARGADPVAIHDFATKNYVDSNFSQTTTTLIFQPGGSTSKNVFTSWAALYAAASSVTGSLTVFFDGTFSSNAATIPAGTYAFTQPEVIFKCAETGSGGFVTATVVLTMATGVTLSGVTRYENLVVNNAGTSAVTTFSGSSVTTLSAKRTVFHGSGTAPYFALTGTAHLYIMSELAGIGDGTNVAVSVGSTAFFNPLLFNGGFVQINAISGSTGTALGSTNVGVAIYGSGLCEQTNVAVYYIGSSPDTFSWQPGQPATNYGNQFADWATLVAAVNNAAVSSNITISFDCSATGGVCTIPSGTWAFTKGSVTFDGGLQPISFSGLRHVTLADGAHLTGVRRFRHILLDTTATTSSPMTLNGEIWDIFGCLLQASGSKSLIAANASSTNNLFFDDFDYLGDGTHQVIDGTASGSLTQLTARTTVINANSLSLTGVGVTAGYSVSNNSGVPTNIVTSPPVFVFNTSLLAGNRVVGTYFSNWGDLVVAANILSIQPITVFFNGNATIPAGTWAFANPKVTFAGQPPNIATAVVIQVANGATISGVTDFDTVVMQSLSTAPVMTYTSSSGALVHLHFGTQIEGSSTAPFFSVTGTGALTLFIEANSLLGGNGFAAASTVGSTSVITFVMKDLTTLDTGSVSGSVPSNLAVIMEGSSPINRVPSVTTTVYEALSKQTVYDDTVVPSPSLGVTVQAAIDALKGRVVNTLPSPGSNGQVLTVVSGSAAWAPAPSGGSGITQLTQDVTAGPGSGSQVAQVNSASGTAAFAFKPTLFQWLSGTATPTIGQATAGAGLSGATMTLQAQNGGTGTTSGGVLVLQGGTATGAGVPGSVAMAAGDASYGLSVGPFGIGLGGTTGSRVSWTHAVAAPLFTQDDPSSDVTPANMTIRAQNSLGPTHNAGAELFLLGGTGTTSQGVLAGTPDGLNFFTASSLGVDLLSAHSYRIGNFGGTFPSGTGTIAIKDASASPTSQIPGGIQLESKASAFEVDANGIEFTPFETNPFLTQERAAAAASGATLQIAAQAGGTGNTTGGNLLLQSGPGAGSGVDGTLQLLTGNGSNSMVLLPGGGGGQSHFSFASGVTLPYFTQESPGTAVNGQDLVIRAQSGGPGTTTGGNTVIQGGIQGSSGLGAHGVVLLESPDTLNQLIVPSQGTAADLGSIFTRENALGTANAINYAPGEAAHYSQKISQFTTEAKHVDVCHISSALSSSASCVMTIPMHVPAMMSVAIRTMCRVTTGASGTTTGDTVTTTTNGDWKNSSPSSTPVIVGPSNYDTIANGASSLNVISYALSGTTIAALGAASIVYTVSTSSGFNLGIVDCTTYTDEFYN